MHRITNPNLEILEAAVELLDELIDQLVFLGGCATGLLLTDIAAPLIRATHGGCHHRSSDYDGILSVGRTVASRWFPRRCQ